MAALRLPDGSVRHVGLAQCQAPSAPHAVYALYAQTHGGCAQGAGMSVTCPDDFILLMDFLPCAPAPDGVLYPALPVADLRRFRDAGAQTVVVLVYWHLLEPARGVYDWPLLDGAVSR